MDQPLSILPQGTRLATIDDFHRNGSRLAGLVFYVERTDGKYDQYTMSSTTSAEKLNKFINQRRVFVFH